MLVLIEAGEDKKFFAGVRVYVPLQALGADLFHHALHRRVDAGDADVVGPEVRRQHGVARRLHRGHHPVRSDRNQAGDVGERHELAAEPAVAVGDHRLDDVAAEVRVLGTAGRDLGAQQVPLHDVSRIIAIGSDRMMNAVRAARHGALRPYLNPAHVGIGSINSPMQCMMKEVCAQCLQRHVDPVTGREEFIFSCYNQDQELDRVDFANLRARLRQNSVQEKISNLWFEHVLDQAESQLVHV